MSKISKNMQGIFSIFIRYVLLVIVAYPSFWLFYFIFTPLTVYPVYFLLNIFFDSSLMNNVILVGECPMEIIRACIAGSAYYLLLIFNLSIPNIKFPKRIKMILLAFASFLIINILRIFLLSIIYLEKSSWFDITHKLFWYLGSIVFVIGIWFAEVKLFKIKEIPLYSDIKFLYKKTNLKK